MRTGIQGGSSKAQTPTMVARIGCTLETTGTGITFIYLTSTRKNTAKRSLFICIKCVVLTLLMKIAPFCSSPRSRIYFKSSIRIITPPCHVKKSEIKQYVKMESAILSKKNRTFILSWSWKPRNSAPVFWKRKQVENEQKRILLFKTEIKPFRPNLSPFWGFAVSWYRSTIKNLYSVKRQCSSDIFERWLKLGETPFILITCLY